MEKQTATPTTTASPIAPPIAPPTVMPIEQATQLVEAMERLIEKIDRERDESSLVALKLILDEHGDALKRFMRPENALHPDISWYNPQGERDHPRPPLRRPAFFLGSPLELANLSVDEIHLLNRFDHTIEVNLKGKLWKAAILRDMGGSEVLYLSLPFKNFDDLRGITGGITEICETLLNNGKRPKSQDLMNEQIQLQRSEIEELKAAIAALQQQTPQVVTGSPV